MADEARATANLKRSAAKTAKRMMADIKKAIADVDKLIAENVKRNPYGWLDAGRENAYSAIDKRFGELRKALDAALGQLALASAKSGNKEAIEQSKGLITQFSQEHLQDYLERVTPKNGPSLAAVYTSSMSASAKAALRATAISVFTSAAATGQTMTEQARQFKHEWALRAKDANPYRFIDKSGRAWENARYIQMLTRTTAQRVQTAAFCDSMLSDGFPLARISNDTDHDCGVCSEWEGRLIDLTPGHQLGGRTYTLQEAREAGVFHPNCLHRLEYVSISEIPKSLWAKVKDKIGVPGAWKDNPSATKPDLPNARERKTHEKQIAKAAEERAKTEYSSINNAIGQKGTWKDLGLPPGIDIFPEKAERLISVEEATRRLEEGEIVVDPLGNKILFKEKAAKHLNKKGRDKKELEARLKSLDRAKGTCEHPHEIWEDQRTNRTKYIRILEDDEGRIGINVVTEDKTSAFSWHSNRVSLDHYRNGKLVYIRQ